MSAPRQLLERLEARDPALSATRRAGRLAIAAPVLLWFGKDILDRPTLGLFAVVGSIAMTAVVDFTGPLNRRMVAQAALALSGAVLVCLGTLASGVTWVATVAALLGAFAILFAGIFSSLFAASTVPLLLAFLLPLTFPGGPDAIPDRLGGWLLAGAVTVLQVRFLWPAPTREPLRGPTVAACLGLARQLRAEAGGADGAAGRAEEQSPGAAREQARAAVAALRGTFLATPYRPGGLSTSSRALVRAVDQVIWLAGTFEGAPLEDGAPMPAGLREAMRASADLLEGAAVQLDRETEDRPNLLGARRRLNAARLALQQSVVHGITAAGLGDGDGTRGAGTVISAAEPSFRAQEISFLVASAAGDLELAVAARRRTWWQQLLGRDPGGHGSALSSIRQRAGAYLRWDSVWLQNSLRGATALAISIAIANLSGVQHSFWVIFGTLAVLRSNALATGQDTVQALTGTVAGILVGGSLVALVGSGSTASWLIFAPVVALVPVAPSMISFAAGQAAFTMALLTLNNIVSPAGWSAGLVRFEDIAIGCGVSVLVGLLFWPRGAAAALRRSLAAGLVESARYVRAAVAYGVGRGDSGSGDPLGAAREDQLSAAAWRRLDDAFRAYVAERGSKQLPLGDVTALVGSVSLLRLTARAVIDLWRGGDTVDGDSGTARRQVFEASTAVFEWYERAARALSEGRPLPTEGSPDTLAGSHLLEAVRRDFPGDGEAGVTATRIVWTADHIDASRRLEAEILEHTATLSSD